MPYMYNVRMHMHIFVFRRYKCAGVDAGVDAVVAGLWVGEEATDG